MTTKAERQKLIQQYIDEGLGETQAEAAVNIEVQLVGIKGALTSIFSELQGINRGIVAIAKARAKR